MPIGLIIQLVAQAGIPLAMELLKQFEADPTQVWSSAQLLALHQKWGSLSAADYLAQAGGAPTSPPLATSGLAGILPPTPPPLTAGL